MGEESKRKGIGTTYELTRSFSGISAHSQEDLLKESTPLLQSQRKTLFVGLSMHGLAILVCACLSCFAGGTMYAYGVWGSYLKADANLTQIQTNVLAGLLFSGGSFLTKPILDHVQVSIRWAAIVPGLAGAMAYLLLGLLPIEYLTMNVLVVLMCVVGYSVMGLFIAGVQAIQYVCKKDGFNFNVGTAIAQTSYGIGCMVWIGLLKLTGSEWRWFCLLIVLPTALIGIFAGIVYPTTYQVESVYHTKSTPPNNNNDISRYGGTGGGNDDDEEDGEEEKQNGGSIANPSKVVSTQQYGRRKKKKGGKVSSSTAAVKCVLLPLILLLYLIWYGSAIALESNSGTIMESIGAGEDAFLLVMGFGVGQTLGRLSSLFFALWARAGNEDLDSSGRRLLVQPIVGTFLLFTIHMYASFGPSTPWVATMVITLSGIPYGMSWTSLFHTIDAVFSSSTLSTTLGMAFGPGLGPLLMNGVVGFLYEAQIMEQNHNHHHHHDENAAATTSSTTCLGSHCYATSYYAFLCCDFVAFLLAVTLYWLSKRVVLPVKLLSSSSYS